MLFLVLLLLLKFSVVKPQGQVSGNAMDLASMNINMMNRKCPLQTCQSVCLRKQQSGCYICNPSCSTGNNLGLPENGLPLPIPPINPGQGFYTGCVSDSTWMNCPVTCQREFDQKGCFQCHCLTPSVKIPVSTPEFYQTSTTKATHNPFTTVPTTETNIHKEITNSVAMETTSISPTTATFTSTSNLHSTEMKTTKSPTLSTPESRGVSTIKPMEIYHYNSDQIYKNETTDDKHSGMAPTTTQDNEKSSTSAVILPSNGEHKTRDESKVNNLSFLFLGLMLVFVVLTIGFFYAWRKAERKLRKNKDELYFVHKTYRQDSTARLSRNEISDPVYVDVTPRRPQPPPRHLHDGNQLPPLRMLSQTCDTQLTDKLSEKADVKHDYLELI